MNKMDGIWSGFLYAFIEKEKQLTHPKFSLYILKLCVNLILFIILDWKMYFFLNYINLQVLIAGHNFTFDNVIDV